MRWLGIILILFYINSSVAQQHTEALFDQAYQALDDGQNEKAIALFTRALQEKPGVYDGYFYRGLAKLNNHDKEGALTDYSIFLEFNPDNAEALLQRGQLHYELNHYQLALDDFRKLLITPKGETSSVFFRMPRYGQGTDKIFTSQNNQKDYIYNHIGLCHIKLGTSQKAIIYFDSAINLNPTVPDYFVHKGLAYQALNDNLNAKESYEAALKLDSTNGLALHNLAVLNKSQHNDALSEQYYTKSIEASPNLPYAYAERGYYRLENKNYNGAIADFSEALKRDPRDFESLLNRGIAFEKLKSYDKALNDYNKVLAIKPELSKAYLNIGNVYMKMKEYSKAKNNYDLAIIYDHSSGLAYYNRAIAHNALKEKLLACTDLVKAERLGIPISEKMKRTVCDDNN